MDFISDHRVNQSDSNYHGMLNSALLFNTLLDGWLNPNRNAVSCLLFNDWTLYLDRKRAYKLQIIKLHIQIKRKFKFDWKFGIRYLDLGNLGHTLARVSERRLIALSKKFSVKILTFRARVMQANISS